MSLIEDDRFALKAMQRILFAMYGKEPELILQLVFDRLQRNF